MGKTKRPTSWRTKFAVVVFSTGIGILLCEIAIRTYDAARGYGFFSVHRTELPAGLRGAIPFRTFGRRHLEERDGEIVITGRHGQVYPLKKLPGSFRILCFGGSTTEGKPDANYPNALERILRERTGREDNEVINVGFSAYATPHSLILLELEALHWDADLVILCHNFNDLTAGYFPGFEPAYTNKYGHPYYLRGADLTERFTTMNAVFQHLQLYWVVKKRLRRLTASTHRPSLTRTSQGRKANPEAAAVFERNLRSFVTIAKMSNIDVVLWSQPLEPSEEFFLRHMEHKAYNDTIVYPRHEEFVSHFREYNEILRSVAESMGASFVDNDRHLGGKREYFVDFVHYTATGAEQVAHRLANHILERELTQPPHRLEGSARRR